MLAAAEPTVAAQVAVVELAFLMRQRQMVANAQHAAFGYAEDGETAAGVPAPATSPISGSGIAAAFAILRAHFCGKRARCCHDR